MYVCMYVCMSVRCPAPGCQMLHAEIMRNDPKSPNRGQKKLYPQQRHKNVEQKEGEPARPKRKKQQQTTPAGSPEKKVWNRR